ncbi:carbohydrate porin [Bradyrhizobium xenonodulans]|uniref:Carbohydrate porin n=1 Tax=Bradyrhizobium xenonodulans TaxID=2736875 RepID=A0ABY7MJ53_9BRAD|nr:carbohydrate porin [Bradyrhizobium xenonodulans]WBL77986.1 carbohydrate porin [Bradyrhizobium xenonodulans]
MTRLLTQQLPDVASKLRADLVGAQSIKASNKEGKLTPHASVAMSVRTRSTAAPVFSARSTLTQTGFAIAVSFAASLVCSPALAGAEKASDTTNETPDEAPGPTIQKQSGAAVSVRRRQLKRTAPLAARSAPAQATNAPDSRHDRPDKVAETKPPEKIDPFAKFDNLREKGTWLNIPGPADTIDQDKGGVRSALADLGIGYVGWTQNTLIDNRLPHASKSTIFNQRYVGESPTFGTVNFMIVTYDLSRFGIPDGQISVGAEQQYWTWKPAGPDRVGINTFAYYQTFFDRTLELKMGYLRNHDEFLGMNPFGPTPVILSQAGMSNNSAPTPALNVKYNFDDRLYTKFSIQRSVSPDGQLVHITENPSGLDWRTADASILLLDETGFKNKAAPGLPETWLRAGIGFNDSRYPHLAYPLQPRANANSAYYVAADRQFWQADPQGSPARGIYGGFSAMYAPSDVNKVSRYLELRLYAKGLFSSRPGDRIAIAATNIAWSHFAVDAALAKGDLVHRDSTAIWGRYTARLAPGVYATLGLLYINHPSTITYTRQTGHALNVLVSTSVFF